MFPARYFAPRFWAERHWPSVGASMNGGYWAERYWQPNYFAPRYWNGGTAKSIGGASVTLTLPLMGVGS